MNNKKISEHMRAIGAKGGKATAKKGSKYMSRIGRKGYEALAKKQKATRKAK